MLSRLRRSKRQPTSRSSFHRTGLRPSVGLKFERLERRECKDGELLEFLLDARDSNDNLLPVAPDSFREVEVGQLVYLDLLADDLRTAFGNYGIAGVDSLNLSVSPAAGLVPQTYEVQTLTFDAAIYSASSGSVEFSVDGSSETLTYSLAEFAGDTSAIMHTAVAQLGGYDPSDVAVQIFSSPGNELFFRINVRNEALLGQDLPTFRATPMFDQTVTVLHEDYLEFAFDDSSRTAIDPNRDEVFNTFLNWDAGESAYDFSAVFNYEEFGFATMGLGGISTDPTHIGRLPVRFDQAGEVEISIGGLVDDQAFFLTGGSLDAAEVLLDDSSVIRFRVGDISAVPEPTLGLALVVVGAALAARRNRTDRSVASVDTPPVRSRAKRSSTS